MGFDKDLELGKKYEIKSLKYFKYDDFMRTEGYNKNYDLVIIKDGIKTKIEVKCDRLSYKTGNLAIEYIYKNQPSGIKTSKADYYIYFVIHPDNKHTVYKFPIEKLKILCRGRRSVTGGDNNKSIMYLLPVSDLDKFKTRTVNNSI